uniref:Uncharacterized protein n=1 Tax=Arundo donax TaxID=35708 RepID=A0A0A9CB20_ARUDO
MESIVLFISIYCVIFLLVFLRNNSKFFLSPSSILSELIIMKLIVTLVM